MAEPKPDPFTVVARLGPPWQDLDLNQTNSEPYYQQLTRQIQAWIENGKITEGRNLPSERDLALALGLSRTTVKRCYDALRQSNLLGGKGRAGSKIQIPTRVEPTLGKLKGFTQEMQELGMTATSDLESKDVVLNRMMASLFSRPSNAQFLRLVRIRSGNDTPMTREIAWYDLTAAPLMADWNAQGSAYSFLKDQCDITLGSADQTVEAVLSSNEEMQAFGFENPQPCLLFKRKTYSRQGRLVEYVEGTFRGDAYVYRIKLNSAD
jgi:GntR family transcriptional regulator